MRLLHPHRVLRTCTRVGRCPVLRGRPFVENFGRIEIGDDFCLVSTGVQSHLVTGPRGQLRIGDGVRIDFGAAIAAHASITIGDRVQIGPFAMLMDTDFHDAAQHDVLPEGEPILIAADARLGARVTVLKGSSIGAGATVLAGSVVSGVVPPGAVVGGVPARIIGNGEHPAEAFDPEGRDELELAAGVQRVVAQAFALAALPGLDDGPDQIAGWDSLGTLRLILALEGTFGVALSEDDLVRARSVRDLVTALVPAQHAGESSA